MSQPHQSGGASIDILMVTHERPAYARLALERLLSTCGDGTRIWIWHNGGDVGTLAIVREHANHPRVHCVHVSPQNVGLRAPTNWLWSNADGAFVGKVDDDCLVTEGWTETLRTALLDAPELGMVGCWRFRDEDFLPHLASKKIRPLAGGHRILQNCWIQGSGYLAKRDAIASLGQLQGAEEFPAYCRRLAAAGWLIGWYYPFVREEHMDDPRSPYALVPQDPRISSLTARAGGARTVEERVRQIRRFALEVQTASVDPRAFVGWRRLNRVVRRRLESTDRKLAKAFGRAAQ